MKKKIIISFLLFFSGLNVFADKNPISLDSLNSKQKKIQIGVKCNIGIVDIPNLFNEFKPLIRPTFTISVLQNISEKSKLQFEIYNSVYGTKSAKTINPADVFYKFNYLGISLDYLKKLSSRKPLFIGIGMFNDFLYRSVLIIENNDIRIEDGIYTIKGYRKSNIGGQLKVQYHLNLLKKITTIGELKYAKGFSNIYNIQSYKTTGLESFTEGVSFSLGVFF